MSDNRSDVLELGRKPHLDVLNRVLNDREASPTESEEDSCSVFGFLRGVGDRALALELRYANGNSDWYAYSCLVSWRFNPSVGLLLKFTGDVVTLVLFRGSRLDALVNGTVDLPRAIQRHRVLWVRELDKAEVSQVSTTEPVVDKIEIGECDSQEELREWLQTKAPAFLRQ